METSNISEVKNISNLANDLISSNTPPLFSYFLDGSRRTYKVEDIGFGKKVYPVVVGQVGVGVCLRVNKKMQSFKMTKSNVIALPSIIDKDGKDKSKFSETLQLEINRSLSKNVSLNINKIILYKTDETGDYESKAVASIQDFMIEEEKRMVAILVKANNLSESNYLIKDGSLEYKQVGKESQFTHDKIRNNYKFVVGVSKSFDPNMLARKNNKIATTIANLKPFHRTCAYKLEFEGNYFAVWYVRIRKAMRNPFDGVLKVEQMLSQNDATIETSIVDTISANLINERNPVCYGADNRWANHLYPVYLTESYIKSKYVSNDYFMNIF